MNIIILIITIVPSILLLVILIIKYRETNEEDVLLDKKILDLQAQNYLANFNKQLILRRKIMTYLFLVMILIGPIFFLIVTHDENPHRNERNYFLGLNLRYFLTVVTFLIFILLASPFILIIRKYFNNFLNVVNSLCNSDLVKLKTLNDKLSFINKYMPPYIIKDKSIFLFNVFKGFTVIKMENLTDINVRRTNVKSEYFYKLTITSATEKKQFSLPYDEFLKENFIDEIFKINPNIRLTNS